MINDSGAAPVETHGGNSILVPKHMSLDDAVLALQVEIDRRDEEEEYVSVTDKIFAAPFDGALALHKAMGKMFGFAVQKENMFVARQKINIAVDHLGNTVTVPWGIFRVPGIDGEILTGKELADGRMIFSIEARIRQKFKPKFDELVKQANQIFLKESIYRGKALDIDFSGNTHGQKGLLEAKFIDVTTAVKPILNSTTEDKLATEVLSYLTHAKEIRKRRGFVKRGALFVGPFGTGKTMSAGWIAKQAVDCGFTFIYCKPADISLAIDFARVYQPALIFAEDLESIARHERTEVVNELLRKVDGIDTKTMDLISIFTTNNVDAIAPAMLRPGRIDVIVNYGPPDEEAAVHLVKFYDRQNILAGVDLNVVAGTLAGLIPARIQDVVGRLEMRLLLTKKPATADLVKEIASEVKEEEQLLAVEKTSQPSLSSAASSPRASLVALGQQLVEIGRDGHDRM